MSSRLLLVLTAVFAVSLPLSAASIITNGSFETASSGNSTPVAGEDEVLAPGSNAIADWTVVGPDNISWLRSGFSGIAAEDGSDFLDLTGPGFGPTEGGVQQTVTLASGNYMLTFYLGSLDNSEPDSVEVSAGNQSSVVFTDSDTGAGYHWNLETLNFNVSANGPVTISLVGDPAGTEATSPYVGLDNVSVESVPSPTPEPATALLTFLALGGLLPLRRCKIRASNSEPLEKQGNPVSM